VIRCWYYDGTCAEAVTLRPRQPQASVYPGESGKFHQASIMIIELHGHAPVPPLPLRETSAYIHVSISSNGSIRLTRMYSLNIRYRFTVVNTRLCGLVLRLLRFPVRYLRLEARWPPISPELRGQQLTEVDGSVQVPMILLYAVSNVCHAHGIVTRYAGLDIFTILFV